MAIWSAVIRYHAKSGVDFLGVYNTEANAHTALVQAMLDRPGVRDGYVVKATQKVTVQKSAVTENIPD